MNIARSKAKCKQNITMITNKLILCKLLADKKIITNKRKRTDGVKKKIGP